MPPFAYKTYQVFQKTHKQDLKNGYMPDDGFMDVNFNEHPLRIPANLSEAQWLHFSV